MSTTLELDDDGEGVHKGLLTLVLSLVDIIDEALEKEAVRRMESGELTDEEVERLGAQLKQLSAEIERLKQQEGVDESVDEFRGQLDTLVADAITNLHTSTERHE
jgi:hypothetical protein